MLNQPKRQQQQQQIMITWKEIKEITRLKTTTVRKEIYRYERKRKKEWMKKRQQQWLICLFVCLFSSYFFPFLSFSFPLDGARAKEVLQFIRFFLSLSFFASLFACRIPSHSDKKMRKHTNIPNSPILLFNFSFKRNLLFSSSVCARARVCVDRCLKIRPPKFTFFEKECRW